MSKKLPIDSFRPIRGLHRERYGVCPSLCFIHEAVVPTTMHRIQGWTALHSACLNGSASRNDVKRLRSQLHSCTSLGNTPLHFACARPIQSTLSFALVEEGADILARNDADQTPLHVAAAHFSPRQLDTLLLKASPKKLDCRDEIGCTPLHWAIQQSDNVVGAAVVLLCAGASAEAADNSGDTPLHYAAREGNFKLFKLLVNSGADREIKNARGLSPIHVACEVDDEEFLLQYLENYPGDLPITTRSESTLLHVAARNGSETVVEVLFKELGPGAVDAKDYYGQTPLLVAVANKHFSIACRLEEMGGLVPGSCTAVLKLVKDARSIPQFGDSDEEPSDSECEELAPISHTLSVLAV